MNTAKREAPAAARNREPIAAVLARELPEQGTILEVASGTGEHALYFAERFAHLTWQPSDPDPAARASIAAWRDEAQRSNLLAPLDLDAANPLWPLHAANGILCINMVHISLWASTTGLMRGAGALLPRGAPLILYGPYRRCGVVTVPSNEAFDRSLKERNGEWGLRDMEAVVAEATENGLDLARLEEMPANNLILVFRRG